jgi:hypothetical protein
MRVPRFTGDPNDRARLYEEGEGAERVFVDKLCPLVGLPFEINPEKEDDPTAADLTYGAHLCDLKTTTTPFFKSMEAYDIHPAWAVSLNVMDVGRYTRLHKLAEFWIIYWADWDEQHNYGYSVPDRYGVWSIQLGRITNLIFEKRLRKHTYQTRGGPGNAKDSYGLDLRWMTRLL